MFELFAKRDIKRYI